MCTLSTCFGWLQGARAIRTSAHQQFRLNAKGENSRCFLNKAKKIKKKLWRSDSVHRLKGEGELKGMQGLGPAIWNQPWASAASLPRSARLRGSVPTSTRSNKTWSIGMSGRPTERHKVLRRTAALALKTHGGFILGQLEGRNLQKQNHSDTS